MYIKFLNNTSILENCAVTKIKQGVIRLYCKDMPVNPYAGFYVYLDRACTVLIGNYEAYRTKYKDSANKEVLYLSTGETYTAPPVQEPAEPTLEEPAEQERQQAIDALQSQIAAYKAQIDATDYRIIKAYEYRVVGLESKYDMDALHTERQSFRDEINRMEEELQKLNEKGEIGCE